MISHPAVPWFVWAALSLAILVAGTLAGRRVRPEHPLVPFAAGVLVGLVIWALLGVIVWLVFRD